MTQLNLHRAKPAAAANRLLLYLGVVAIFAVGGTLPYSSSAETFNPLWIILPSLAFLAEMLPVEVSRRGVRITFTLPYVVGMALTAGPVGAIATEIVVTAIAGWLRGRSSLMKPSVTFIGINTCIAAICASVGFLMLHSVTMALHRTEVAAIAFTLAYSLMNFALVAYVDYATSQRSLSDNVMKSLEVGLLSILVYTLFVAAVAVLVGKHLDWLIPFTLVPVWAIRTGLLQKAEMYEHYYETITALTLMLQRAHPYTHGHLERVAHTAEDVARRLGLSSGRARLVREAAVLHDVGKIAVDEEILDKPGKLTVEEMDHVRRHAEWGAEILGSLKQFRTIATWIRHHHERPDGQGYPGRLKMEQIPLESRIIAVVDAFDAMTDCQDGKPGRVYRQPLSIDEAVVELDRCAGQQFDERVVQVFKEVIGR